MSQTTLSIFAQPKVTKPQRLQGRVAGLFGTLGQDFETHPVERLELGFDGIGCRPARSCSSRAA